MLTTLCIDGGGTFSKFILLNNSNVVNVFVLDGGSNIKKNNNALTVLDEGINRAMSQIGQNMDVFIIAGISGIDTNKDRDTYIKYFKKYPYKLILLNDTALALDCIFGQDDGIVVVAGTGSNIISRCNGNKVQNIDLGLDTEAGSRYIVRDFVNKCIEEDSIESINVDMENQIKTLIEKFDLIDFNSYNESNHLAKDIVYLAANGSNIAKFTLNNAILNLVDAVSAHVSYHDFNKARIALYGGLFTSSFVVNQFRNLANVQFGKDKIEIKAYDTSILYNSYKITKRYIDNSGTSLFS